MIEPLAKFMTAPVVTPAEPIEELWQLWGMFTPGLTDRVLDWLAPRMN
jgi:hypothetical protein